MGSLGADNPAFVPDSEIVTTQDKGQGVESEAGSEKGSLWKPNFTARQWRFLVIFGVTNFFRAASILCTPSFFPSRAQNLHEGVTETDVGFVMGTFDFSTFAVVLLFGKFIIPRYGPRKVLELSTLNSAVCTVLFGWILYVKNEKAFLTLAYLIRILWGAGDGGFYPSAFTIFAEEFGGAVSTAIGLFEFLFGIGTIVAPLLLGAIIDHTGFPVVYGIIGIGLFVSVGLNHFFIPPPIEKVKESNGFQMTAGDAEVGNVPPVKRRHWYHLLLLPGFLLLFFNLFTTAASIGFIAGTLESHLDKTFGISSFHKSAILTVSNGIYAFTTPVWGKVADLATGGWRHGLIYVGTGAICIGYCLLGPLPFISEAKLPYTIVGLGIHGLGIGAAVMSAFPYSADLAIEDGFPSTEKTFSLISSMYILTFTLGNAMGPSIAGILVDNLGFQSGTSVVVGLSLLVLLLTTVLAVVEQLKKRKSKAIN